jgi:hypothetical protein
MGGAVRRLSVAAVVLAAACSHGPAPSASSSGAAVNAPKKAELTRVTTATLFQAYAGDAAAADAVYRGKRYTVVGPVASIQVDAGAQKLVLGSKLESTARSLGQPSAFRTWTVARTGNLDPSRHPHDRAVSRSASQRRSGG